MNTWALLLLAVVATAVVVLPGWRRERRLATGTWVIGWLCAISLALVLAVMAGTVSFEDRVCATAEGDCDLGVLEGLLWAAITLVVLLAVWVVDAVRRLR